MELTSHIRIRDLSVRHGRTEILKGISLDIPDRKITAIIGPSGCGKTTLLKSMNRLVDSADGIEVQGEIFVDGENIYDPKVEVTHLRRKMGLLSQKPQVLPMSIYDNIAYGPRIHGIRNRKKLHEIVEHYRRLARRRG